MAQYRLPAPLSSLLQECETREAELQHALQLLRERREYLLHTAATAVGGEGRVTYDLEHDILTIDPTEATNVDDSAEEKGKHTGTPD